MSSHPRLNFLHLVIDDLRPDLGAYGRAWARTPHLDALAARGVVFTQAHASVANCAPSRAALFSGQRPDFSGVHDLHTPLRSRSDSIVTLPEQLRRAGYLTVGYGKILHAEGDAPSWSTQAEFADNHTCRSAPAGCAGVEWSYWEYTDPRRRARVRSLRRPRPGAEQFTRSSASGDVRSFDLLHERGPDGNPEGEGFTDHRLATLASRAVWRLGAQPKPWYLCMGFVRPHLPFISPAPFYDAASTAHPLPPRLSPPAGASPLTARSLQEGGPALVVYHFKAKELAPVRSETRGGRRTLSLSEDGRTLAAAYAAAVAFVDHQVGRVLRELAAAGLDQQTVVAAMGDHGWKLGHLGGWGKHSLMAQDTHVPLIIAPPPAELPSARRGARVREPCELLDVYPSLLALARVAADAPLAGRSLLPALLGRAPPRGIAFSQWPFGLDWKGGPQCTGYAVRTANWTLLQWVTTPVRCSRHRCDGPLRGADAAEWAALPPRALDRCVEHADLFRTPRHAGDRPDVEPDAANVIARYPAAARRLRQALVAEMQLEPHRAGLALAHHGKPKSGARSRRRRRTKTESIT
jgi:arylsulfatase A-like enzyme